MDEITITRDDLARDLRIHLRVVRQKKPHIFRNLATMKDERGYPDHAADAKAITALAEDIADWMSLTGKRIIRDRGRAPGGLEQTLDEMGVEPVPSKQIR